MSTTGLRLIPTATFGTCPPLDVLCVPGGGGVNALPTDADVLGVVRSAAASCSLVTSVCTRSMVLGATGLLTGKKATSHSVAADLLDCFGAIPTAGRVVRDGRIMTAGGVTSGIDFALEVVADLFGRDVAETVQLALEYDSAPPFDAGTPGAAHPEVLVAARKRLAPTRREREAILSGLAGSR